jgi:hypothetical protein
MDPSGVCGACARPAFLQTIAGDTNWPSASSPEDAATFISQENMAAALGQWIRFEYPQRRGAGWVSRFA